MLYIYVVASPALGDVPIGVLKLPLALAVAGVIARGSRGDRADLCQESALHIPGVKVAADVQILNHKFAGPDAFRRSRKRVVDRVGIVVYIVGVHAKFTREILSIQNRVVVARIAVQPGEVPVCERGIQVDRRGWRSGSWRGLRHWLCLRGLGWRLRVH